MRIRPARALLERSRADRATLPSADRRVELAARLVALFAALWFALAAAWEIGAPFAAGHYAASSAIATGGENMWRWGVIAPVPHYTLVPPQKADFYCHHPFGVFWTAAIFVQLFGHEYWVCRLPAVLMSAATPLLLYGFGRAAWGPVAGAVSAISFTVVPIALAYANFHALEVPVIFGIALFAWGYARLCSTGRRRWLATSLAGLGFAINADWAGFVFAALFLPVAFARGFLLRRFFPAVDLRRYALFWALAACLSVASAGFHLLVFHALGKLDDFLSHGGFRSAGADTSLSLVLESRRHWIESAFTPLVVLLGKLSAPLLLLRLTLLRREVEWIPLAVLGMAIFQYVVFKQGADVHFFWPHYFALYFALAAGATSRTLQSGVARLLLSVRPSRRALAPWFALFSGLFVAATVLPDGLRALVYARKTGGRFNEKGSIIHPDVDKAAALDFLSRRMESGTSLVIHPGMKQSYWMDFLLMRPVRVGRAPHGRADGGDQYFVLDARFASASELGQLAERSSVTAVGPFWFVDRTRPQGAFEAFRVERREPSPLEWYFVQGSHALRSVAPDPWAVWELEAHFGGAAATPPRGEPRDLEQVRIAFNVAVATGDRARADRLWQRLTGALVRDASCSFDDGTELVGVHFERGASDVLGVYFRTNAENPAERRYRIDSIVEASSPWSLLPPDPVVREVGMPPAIPPSLWKSGFVYSTLTEIAKRPGREHFVGRFEGPGAPSRVCSEERPLLTLE